VDNSTWSNLPVFQGFKDYTTKVLDRLVGKNEITKSEMSHVLNQIQKTEGISKPELDLVNESLKKYGDKIPIQEFAQSIHNEILPLKPYINPKPGYENFTSDFLQGGKYGEVTYESPIKTSAGQIHSGLGERPNYFSHVRYEDLPGVSMEGLSPESKIRLKDKAVKGGDTRRILEVQSDLTQNDRIKYNQGYRIEPEDISKLNQYQDNTRAHLRTFREEIKRASQNGKTKLQFPTGETAMKIEGLGSKEYWYTDDGLNIADNLDKLKPGTKLRRSNNIIGQSGQNWTVTSLDKDNPGKFYAIDTNFANHHNMLDKPFSQMAQDELIKLRDYSEAFDVLGHMDKSHFVYRLNETDIPKEARKLGYDVKKITDNKGDWWQIDLKGTEKKSPIKAFGYATAGTILGGATTGVTGIALKQLFTPRRIQYTNQGETPVITQNNVNKEVLGPINNPLSLIYIGQKGATRGSRRPDGTYWANFENETDGYKAGDVDISAKLLRNPNMTLRELITMRSPASDNNDITQILYNISDELSDIRGTNGQFINGRIPVKYIPRQRLLEAIAKSEGYKSTKK
jgi:hypothetical protein